MKILLTTDTYQGQVCGVNKSIETLEQELLKAGHDVRILMMSNDDKSRICANRYLVGSFPLRLIDLRQSSRFSDDVIRKLEAWQPDIIHIQTEWVASIVGKRIAKRVGCPYINTNHTNWNEYTKGLIPTAFLRNLFQEWILKCSYKDSSAIICPSRKSEAYLEKIRIRKPTCIIPTGIDLDHFKAISDSDCRALRSQLKLKPTAKVVLYVGRISKEKNLAELIDYFSELASADQDYVLLCVGGGAELDGLKSMVKTYGIENNVIFAGSIPFREIHKYYRLADVFVSASTCETQGITYMEAMASALPAICRKDKALEGVIENGVNGYVYTDKREFTAFIASVFSNRERYAGLCENALETSRKYSKEFFGQQVEALYRSIIENR